MNRNSFMEKTRAEEISVSTAAKMLVVTERTVLNFIREKHISNKPRQGMRGLNCYRLASDIFLSTGWGKLAEADSTKLGGLISSEDFVSRVVFIQLQILEALGAGYHSFSYAKVKHYGSARAAAGSIVALLLVNETIADKLAAERLAVEEKLLPALIALQRTAEKRERT